MDDRIKTWLFDILNSINEIESYFAQEPDLNDYVNDIKTKRAVERNIEIIGEAVNRILHEVPDFDIKNSHKIIGTRNRIAHGYDRISDELVFSIIVSSLPELKKEIEKLIKL